MLLLTKEIFRISMSLHTSLKTRHLTLLTRLNTKLSFLVLILPEIFIFLIRILYFYFIFILYFLFMYIVIGFLFIIILNFDRHRYDLTHTLQYNLMKGNRGEYLLWIHCFVVAFYHLQDIMTCLFGITICLESWTKMFLKCGFCL